MRSFNLNRVNLRLLIIIAFLVGTISSCKKEENKDTTGPTINLTEPMNHDHYYQGEAMHFHGTVMDDGIVASVEISVWEEVDPNNPIFHAHFHPNTVSFSLDTSFMISTSDTTEYFFQVAAEDALGNLSATLDTQHTHINE